MGWLFEFLQWRNDKKVEGSSHELVTLRRDFEAFRKKIEDMYIGVCERHEDLRTKLYKRVDYLERKQNKQLTPKQNFISQVAARHGLAVQPQEEEEDDDDVETEIETE